MRKTSNEVSLVMRKTSENGLWESLRLSLSDKAKDGGKESEMLALAASENQLSDLSVSCKTFASLLDKLANAAIKMSFTPTVASMLSWLTLGKTFCRSLVFAFSILANFHLIPFLFFCFLFRALEVDGLKTKPLNVLSNSFSFSLTWAINAEAFWPNSLSLFTVAELKSWWIDFPGERRPPLLSKKALIHGCHFVFELVYFSLQTSELIQNVETK